MTRIDLHPEDLLDRAARGVASFADLTRLKQHLAECAVCRVERALVAQAALDAKPLRDEKVLVDRLTRDVSARLASPTARRARRRSAVVAGALVAVCVAGVAAAATLAIVRRAPALDVATTEAPQTASPVALPSALPSTERSDEAVEAPSVPAPAESAPPPARPAAPTLAPAANAGELFSRANQARRDGKVTEAARLYRSLQERFAGSHEELVSRVSLGRLLLDRLGDSRGALVQFNSYLASPAGGALREEAMVGRALALGRLGRAGEERAAWQALLDTWPKSTHGKRAQARLVALGAASSNPADAERAVDAKGAGGRAR